MITIIIANLILLGSVIPFFDFLIFVPNPALVSVVILSIFKGRYYGAFFGLFLGLFQDLLFGDVIGIYALIYFIIGYSIDMIQIYLNKENTLIHILFTGIATIAYNFLYSIIIYFLARNITLLESLKRIISIEILYNCIIAIIIYKIFYKFFNVSSFKFGKK